MSNRQITTLAVAVTLSLAAALTTAPHAGADPTATLTQAVLAIRVASKCPATQWDPLVQRGAQMANQETSEYLSQRSAAVPFTDPLPALITIGYPGAKGLLLSGYGATEADALHALILQYQGRKPDCSYTQFGVDAFRDDAGFNLASAILTAPLHPRP